MFAYGWSDCWGEECVAGVCCWTEGCGWEECGLRECEVQEGFQVEDRVEEKGHKFMVFDGLEEGGAGESEGEDGQEEGVMVVEGTDED